MKRPNPKIEYYKGYEQGLKDAFAIMKKRDIDHDEIWKLYARLMMMTKLDRQGKLYDAYMEE